MRIAEACTPPGLEARGMEPRLWGSCPSRGFKHVRARVRAGRTQRGGGRGFLVCCILWGQLQALRRGNFVRVEPPPLILPMASF